MTYPGFFRNIGRWAELVLFFSWAGGLVHPPLFILIYTPAGDFPLIFAEDNDDISKIKDAVSGILLYAIFFLNGRARFHFHLRRIPLPANFRPAWYF